MKGVRQGFIPDILSTKKETEIDQLLSKRRILRLKNDPISKENLAKIEDELSEKFAEKNLKIINNEVNGIHSDEGGVNSGKLWKLKAKMIPKARPPPSAKIDPHGNIVATGEAYKKLNVDTYIKHRLREREVEPDKVEIHNYNLKLFEINRRIAKVNKTRP